MLQVIAIIVVLVTGLGVVKWRLCRASGTLSTILGEERERTLREATTSPTTETITDTAPDYR